MAQGNARGIVARRAISAALTGVLAFGGVMAPASAALAETVNITFKDSTGTAVDTGDVKYDKAIKVFSATTIDTTADPDDPWAGGKAEGVSWTDARDTVITFLGTTATGTVERDAEGEVQDAPAAFVTQSYAAFLLERGLDATSGSTDYNSPSNAALYIGQQIAAANKVAPSYNTATTAPNVPHVTDADDFAGKLAAALLDANLGAAFSGTLDSEAVGYYLLADTAGDTNAKPIWLPFSGAATDLYEKAQTPTFQKEGAEAGESETKKVIDAGTGETVTFTLTGEIPADGKTYGGAGDLAIVFEDTLPAGLTLDAGSIKVTVGTEDVTGNFTTNVSGQTFTVTSASSYTLSGPKTIVVTYNTTVNESQQTGSDNMATNKASFRYGENKATTESEASVISYGIKLFKNDGGSTYLEGAKFTIKETVSGKFVQEDGTLGPQSFEFSTDADGKIDAAALDAGTYLISETSAPAGFEPVEDFYLKIEPTYEQVTQELKELKGVIVDENGDALTLGDDAKVSVTAADKGTGYVELTVSDPEEEVRLPITGMTPSQLGTFAGVLLVAAGAAMVLRRRQADQA